MKTLPSIDDGFVKSRKTPFFVIPAEAGIQSFQMVTDDLNSGFHRSDDFFEFIIDEERKKDIVEKNYFRMSANSVSHTLG